MTKERFTEILKEYNYTDEIIERLWRDRPTGHLGEYMVRNITKLHIQGHKEKSQEKKVLQNNKEAQQRAWRDRHIHAGTQDGRA